MAIVIEPWHAFAGTFAVAVVAILAGHVFLKWWTKGPDQPDGLQTWWDEEGSKN